jgi:hypothetical protein
VLQSTIYILSPFTVSGRGGASSLHVSLVSIRQGRGMSNQRRGRLLRTEESTSPVDDLRSTASSSKDLGRVLTNGGCSRNYRWPRKWPQSDEVSVSSPMQNNWSDENSLIMFPPRGTKTLKFA